MSDPMKFEFKLIDLMSAPASTISKTLAAATLAMKNAKPAGDALTATELKTAIAAAKQATETRRLTVELAGYVKQLDPATAKTKRLTVEMGNMFHSFAGFRQNADGGWTLNLADGLGAVANVAQRLAGDFVDLTNKALDAAAAGDKTKRAFDIKLGGGASGDLLAWLDKVAEKSNGIYTKAQLRQQGGILAQAGIAGDSAKNIIAASHSVAAGGGSADSAIEEFANLRVNKQFGDPSSLGFTTGADDSDSAAFRPNATRPSFSV